MWKGWGGLSSDLSGSSQATFKAVGEAKRRQSSSCPRSGNHQGFQLGAVWESPSACTPWQGEDGWEGEKIPPVFVFTESFRGGKNLWDHRVQAVTQHTLVAKINQVQWLWEKWCLRQMGENSASKDTSSGHKACENKPTVHSKLLLLFTFPLERLRVKQNSSPAGVCWFFFSIQRGRRMVRLIAWSNLQTQRPHQPKELKNPDEIEMQKKYSPRKWRGDVLGKIFHG